MPLSQHNRFAPSTPPAQHLPSAATRAASGPSHTPQRFSTPDAQQVPSRAAEQTHPYNSCYPNPESTALGSTRRSCSQGHYSQARFDRTHQSNQRRTRTGLTSTCHEPTTRARRLVTEATLAVTGFRHSRRSQSSGSTAAVQREGEAADEPSVANPVRMAIGPEVP